MNIHQVKRGCGTLGFFILLALPASVTPSFARAQTPTTSDSAAQTAAQAAKITLTGKGAPAKDVTTSNTETDAKKGPPSASTDAGENTASGTPLDMPATAPAPAPSSPPACPLSPAQA